MKSNFFAVALAVAGSAPGHAQTPLSEIPLFLVPSVPARIEAMPRNLPRAVGPSLVVATRLAQAAVASCAAHGGAVSALVTDSVGTPVVLLSGDGAGERSQLIASTKAYATALYRMPSGKVADLATKDARLRAEIKANPNIGVARAGALPLMRGSEFIGVIAVSGLTGMDETCASEALRSAPLP